MPRNLVLALILAVGWIGSAPGEETQAMNEISVCGIQIGTDLATVTRLLGPPQAIQYRDACSTQLQSQNVACGQRAGWVGQWPNLEVRFQSSYSGPRAVSIRGNVVERGTHRISAGTDARLVKPFLKGLSDVELLEAPDTGQTPTSLGLGLFRDSEGTAWWTSLEVRSDPTAFREAILTVRQSEAEGVPQLENMILSNPEQFRPEGKPNF